MSSGPWIPRSTDSRVAVASAGEDSSTSAEPALSGGQLLGRGLRVLGQAIRLQPRLFATALGAGILFSLSTVGMAYVVGDVVANVVASSLARGRVDVAAVAAGMALIVAVGLGKAVGMYARRLKAGAMQFQLQATSRRQVVRQYLRLPLSWHRRHQTGTLIANANTDVEATWSAIAPLPFAVGTVVLLLAAIVALFLTDPALALLGVLFMAAMLALNVTFSRRIAPRVADAQQLRAKLSAVAYESIDGALVVKSLGREAEETERFRASSAALCTAMTRVGRVQGFFEAVLGGLPSLATLGVLAVGAWRLERGAVTVAEVLSVAFLFTVLAFPMVPISQVFAALPRSVVGWQRVDTVLQASGAMRYGTAEPDGSAGPLALRLDGVGFSYGDGRPVLRDVSFEVPAGRTVALVGPTGSGKSTIVALAARLMDPAAGEVCLGGIDALRLSQPGLTGAVALATQVPFVFDDTVRGNVTLDRPGIAEDEVWRALRLAQLEPFVRGLPHGLDTRVGERGTSLSGGQRQRLALARALAGRPGLLLLDDPTSALDPGVEAALMAALRAADLNASILVVAHRRATITSADAVVYVEQGRVAARGTHAELLAAEPGYARLITAYDKAETERRTSHAYEEGVPA